MNFDKIKEQLSVLTIKYGTNILLAAIVLFIGLRLIKIIKKWEYKALEKYSADSTLTSFLTNLTNWVLKAILFISVAQMLGIQAASFIAMIGAVGLAIGLALQGVLANFAGGVLLLIFRPYKIGDAIEVKSFMGKVIDIQIFSTIIEKFDGKTVYIPNGGIMNDSIVNWTQKGFLRFDFLVRIPLDADLEKAQEILKEVLNKEEKVLEAPQKPFVGLHAITDYAMEIQVRGWGQTWPSYAAKRSVMINCKRELEAVGIQMPMPAMGIHVNNHNAPNETLVTDEQP